MWEECQKKVQVLVPQKLGMERAEIDRTHRTGKKVQNKKREIVSRFLCYKDKQNIFRKIYNLKRTNIYINENICENTIQLSKDLWETIKEYRNQNNLTNIIYRNLIVTERKWDTNGDEVYFIFTLFLF